MAARTLPVSIVIPAYNAARTIAATLASIRAQTYAPDEVIVVDDGSTDETGQIAVRYGARVVRQPNGGVSHARNTGVAAARNEWVAFVDADDTWSPEKLERQWCAQGRAPDVALSFTDYAQGDVCDGGVFGRHAAYRDAPREPLGDDAFRWKRDDLLRAFCTVDFLSPVTVMIRRDVYDAAGGFDPAIGYHEDLEFFCRVLALTDAVAVETVLAEYRRHEGNTTADIDVWTRERLRVYELMIDAAERYPATAIEVLRTQRHAFAAGVGLDYLRRGQVAQAAAVLQRSCAARLTARAALLLAVATAARFPGTIALLKAALGLRSAVTSRRR